MPACRTGDQMHGIFHDLFAVCQNNLSGGCDKNMVKAVVAAVFAAGNDPPAHFFCPSVNHLLGQLSVFIQTLFDLIHIICVISLIKNRECSSVRSYISPDQHS